MPIVDANCFLGEGHYTKLLPEDLIAMMDAAGVDQAVVCPVEDCVTVYNREGNDYLVAAMRAFPGRLFGFATVNPWYGAAAVAELRRAVATGLRGLYLNSSIQGYFIHDDLVDPVIAVAQEVGLPVYFHTATPIYALPLQLAELADRFPEVAFIMGHVAAADFWIDAVPAARMHRNIYVETSFRSGIRTLRQAVDELGADHVLFGSGTPISMMDVELAKVRLLGLEGEAAAAVFGNNLLRLIGER